MSHSHYIKKTNEFGTVGKILHTFQVQILKLSMIKNNSKMSIKNSKKIKKNKKCKTCSHIITMSHAHYIKKRNEFGTVGKILHAFQVQILNSSMLKNISKMSLKN